MPPSRTCFLYPLGHFPKGCLPNSCYLGDTDGMLLIRSMQVTQYIWLQSNRLGKPETCRKQQPSELRPLSCVIRSMSVKFHYNEILVLQWMCGVCHRGADGVQVGCFHSPWPCSWTFFLVKSISKIGLLVWIFLLNLSALTQSMMPSSMCYFQVKSHAFSCHWAFIHADPSVEMNLLPSLLCLCRNYTTSKMNQVSLLRSLTTADTSPTKDLSHCTLHSM